MKDHTLTPEQQEFAHAHYGLLLKFMGTYGLTDEEYGPLAERYVKTVKKYLETESLQQYQFSTILGTGFARNSIRRGRKLKRERGIFPSITALSFLAHQVIMARFFFGMRSSSRSPSDSLNC